MYWKIKKAHKDNELITRSVKQLNKPPLDINITLTPKSLINAMTAQEENRVKRTATVGRIYVQTKFDDEARTDWNSPRITRATK